MNYENEKGQSITEYALMLFLVLMVVMGTLRVVGGKTYQELSQINSAIQQ